MRAGFSDRGSLVPRGAGRGKHRRQLNPTYVPEDVSLADRLVARSARREVNENFVHAREAHKSPSAAEAPLSVLNELHPGLLRGRSIFIFRKIGSFTQEQPLRRSSLFVHLSLFVKKQEAKPVA